MSETKIPIYFDGEKVGDVLVNDNGTWIMTDDIPLRNSFRNDINTKGSSWLGYDISAYIKARVSDRYNLPVRIELQDGMPSALEAAAPTQHDAVDHPKHYTSHPSGVECIEITRHMGFNLGNAVKYIWRDGLKGEVPLEDLRKALWYLKDEIATREKNQEVQ